MNSGSWVDLCITRCAQVVGQFFDQKVAHLQLHLFHPQGEEQIEAKLLISIENVTILSGQLTDSGEGSPGRILLICLHTQSA